MAIGDLFKRRRERESALPAGAIEELRVEAGSSPASDPAEAEPGAPGAPGGHDVEPDAATELPGADAAELGAMLRRAAASGLPQVSADSHTVQGGDLGQEILGILGAHGIGGAAGAHEVDPDELRDLHERVREALRHQGVDPGSGLGA